MRQTPTGFRRFHANALKIRHCNERLRPTRLHMCHTALEPRRIVLTTFGSLGDLYPFLALARELKDRGHDPVVATSACYGPLVKSQGVSFYSVRPDIGDFEPAFIKRTWDRRKGSEFLIRELLLPNLRDSYADLIAACNGADLLITHPLVFAGSLVAEKTGIDWATGAITPTVFLSAYDPPVFASAPGLILNGLGPRICGTILHLVQRYADSWFGPWRQFRSEIGLPPKTFNPVFDGQFSPQLVLALFSRLMSSPKPDWPANTVQTGFPFLDGSNEATGLDPDLGAFLAAGDPPVLITLGSAGITDAGAFYTQAALAAHRLGLRSISICGSDPSNQPAHLPPNAFSYAFAPYSLIMPRTCAVIHQGGIGTTARAMLSGKPMLVVPFGFDQFDNAARVSRLGIALTLPLRRFTAARAAALLKRLVSEVNYTGAAEQISRQVQAESGVSVACDRLEGLVSIDTHHFSSSRRPWSEGESHPSSDWKLP